MYKSNIKILLITFGFCALVAMCSVKKESYSDWKTGVAIVTNLWEVDGSEISYEYKVDGKSYKGHGPALQGTMFGDKYFILYNKKNPSQHVINKSVPFFAKNDDVAFTIGTISSSGGKVNYTEFNDKGSYYFEYEYFVDGKRFKREQEFTFCGTKPLELKDGMQFKVKYSVEIPERAVMIISDSNMYIFKNIPCEVQNKLKVVNTDDGTVWEIVQDPK